MRIKRAIVAGAVLAATLGSGTAWATPELSTKDQLKTRRYVAAGDRAYVMGFQDGRFYAQGWHVSGEMGGVWTQPLKLVDGVWFSVDGRWLDPATKFSSGWGYTRMDFPDASGLQISRTDFAPDGKRAALFGLRLRNPGAAKTVDIAVDAHSDLMSHYPWSWTAPNAVDFNAADTGAFTGRSLEFRDTGNATPARTTGPRPSARTSSQTAARPAPATGARSPTRCCAPPRASSSATKARPARAPAASCATRSRSRRTVRRPSGSASPAPQGHRRGALGARRHARFAGARARRQDRLARAAGRQHEAVAAG